MKQKKYNFWIKGCFYAMSFYATSKKEARQGIKELHGKSPYHIEEDGK